MKPLLPLAALLLAPGSMAQTPVVDDDFNNLTMPDFDLVVVRERVYGAAGVDLTAYGIGAGPVDFVQSIYVRCGQSAGQVSGEHGAQLRVRFPVGVEVIGVVTDKDDLGSSLSPNLIETDGIFGVAPGWKYVTGDRGLWPLADESACIHDSRTVFLSFEFSESFEADDVRIIIDYGSSFPAGLAFDVELLAAGSPNANERQIAGIQVGNPAGGVPGSGDYGEVYGLVGIPLTSAGTPSVSSGLAFDPDTSVYLARGTFEGARYDVYDPGLGFLFSSVYEAPAIGQIGGLAHGALGLHWIVGTGAAVGMFEPATFAAADGQLSGNLAGNNVALTGRAGDDALYVARDAAVARVDEVRPCDLQIVRSIQVPALGEPVGIRDAADGLLYVLDADGRLARLDPVTETAVVAWDFGAAEHVELGKNAGGDQLYALRRDAGGTSLSVFDVTTGQGAADVIAVPEAAPVGVCGTAAGDLWVVGNGGAAGQATLHRIDPVTWTVVEQRTSPDGLLGSLRGLAAYDGSGAVDNYCGPAVVNGTGAAATIRARGSHAAGEPLELSAWGLPDGQFGYFVAGQGGGTVFPVAGAVGRLCLGGAPLARYSGQVLNTGTAGRMCAVVSTSAIPLTPPVAAQAGETWNFQGWFRDGTSSNFTDAIAVTFN